MKLFLPVATIFVAAGMCCCCGSDVTSQLEGLGVEVPPELSGGAAPTVTGDAAAPSGAAPSGVALAGTCGKFKDLKAPSGASVMVCSEGGGSDSIVLSGGGAPEDVCKAVKAWGESVGYSTEFDTNASGTYAVTMKGSSDRLTIGCTAMAGQTTSSVSISPL